MGEILSPHPMFRVIVTGNACGAGDTSGFYQGVMMQNLTAMDRFRFTKVGYADPNQERRIFERITPQIPEVIRSSMVRVVNEIRQLFIGQDGQNRQISLTMSTRVLVRWAKLTLQFQHAPNPLEYAFEQAMLARRQKSVKRVCVLHKMFLGIIGNRGRPPLDNFAAPGRRCILSKRREK
jgi:cobaltochelatase CobS